MSTLEAPREGASLSPRPMSLAVIEFAELYERHLCRHSQFGINVAHLAALVGIWWAVYAAAFCLATALLGELAWWVPAAMAAAYFLTLVPNTPARVLAVTALFLALLVASVVFVPALPWWAFWACLLPIPIFYKLQAYSHKIWDVARDMTEFNRKYSKGPVLFVILLFYEVPIVLNYLLFDRKRWA
jgi:hypothetical protein